VATSSSSEGDRSEQLLFLGVPPVKGSSAVSTNAMTPPTDWLTVIAVAVVTHAVAVSMVHEGLGHGGACLLAGCRPQLLTTMQFQGDERTVSGMGTRFIAAGGTLANLVAATIAVGLLRRRRERANAKEFFLWLFATVNLLQAAGYFLYSGVSNIGDWASVVRGLTPIWFWRGALLLLGAYGYWIATRWAMGQLGRRLRTSGAARVAEASRYTFTAYAVGGLLSLLAGLFEPGGALIVLISGVAASLGGTSALAWGPQLLRDPHLGEPGALPLRVTRDWRWIVAGAITAVVFIFVVGRGVPTDHVSRDATFRNLTIGVAIAPHFWRPACQAASTARSRSAGSPALCTMRVRAASGCAVNHSSASVALAASGRKVRPAAIAR